MDWISANDNLKRYSYIYDAMGRLTSAFYSEPNASVPFNNYYNEILSYDLNGNATGLKRNRFSEYTGAQLIDNLAYTYTGNRLDTVVDSSGNYMGYPDTSGTPMTYDENANMKSHVDKNILQLDYNFLNLPNYIKFNNFITTRAGNIYENTKYVYRSDGVKLSKAYNYFSGRNNANTLDITNYLDGFQYNVPQESTLAGAMELKFVPTEEGYYDFTQNKYFYQYKDQVGNVRVTYYKDALGNAVVDRATDFYPFGLEFAGELNTFNSLSPNYLYAFQEQEKQQETGWHSFKWRNYDPSFVRFFNIDPLAETYAYQSPFNFSENSVVAHRELEGLEKSYTFYTPFGNIIFTSGAAGATSSSSPGLYETAKRNATNNWNGIVRHAGNNYNILKAGIVAGGILAQQVLNSEGDDKGDSKAKGGKTEKETGSYTNTHKSGKKYHGKGDKERAAKSGKAKAKEHDDPLESTEWTKAENDREAFKQESERLDKDAEGDKKGHESDKNYNKRDSPGKKYREQDEQNKPKGN